MLKASFKSQKIYPHRTTHVQPVITKGSSKAISCSRAAISTGPTIKKVKGKYHPGRLDIWMLGITIAIGGQYFYWNAGLTAGFYTYIIAYFLIAGAYIILCCCTSEISGALPFAGGAYGLARCTLGFYPAFLIGCCEALEYIIYVSTSVVGFVDMIIVVVPDLEPLKPLFWALFYISSLFFHLKGDRIFWLFNLVIGAISILIAMVYCFGALPYVDLSKYTVDPASQYIDGFHGFMRVLPLAAWFFVGVEAMNLASDQVQKPKQIIPFAQVTCVLTLFVTGTMVLFVSIALSTDIKVFAKDFIPFSNCFVLLFRISRTASTILSLPATYATAFGFMWCYGKLISAMATSNLFPSSFASTTKCSDVPYVALLVGSWLSYAVCMVVYIEPNVQDYLFPICMLSGFVSYTTQCIGFISLRLNYRSIKSSSFRSPFGLVGAGFSMAVWLLGILAIVAFQGNNGIEVLVLLVFVALLSLYYFTYAQKRQTFSRQENRILLVAHVIKFNGKRGASRRIGQNINSKLGSNRQTRLVMASLHG